MVQKASQCSWINLSCVMAVATGWLTKSEGTVWWKVRGHRPKGNAGVLFTRNFSGMLHCAGQKEKLYPGAPCVKFFALKKKNSSLHATYALTASVQFILRFSDSVRNISFHLRSNYCLLFLLFLHQRYPWLTLFHRYACFDLHHF